MAAGRPGLVRGPAMARRLGDTDMVVRVGRAMILHVRQQNVFIRRDSVERKHKHTQLYVSCQQDDSHRQTTDQPSDNMKIKL